MFKEYKPHGDWYRYHRRQQITHWLLNISGLTIVLSLIFILYMVG